MEVSEEWKIGLSDLPCSFQLNIDESFNKTYSRMFLNAFDLYILVTWICWTIQLQVFNVLYKGNILYALRSIDFPFSSSIDS